MQKPSTSHVPLAPAYGYVCKRPAFLAVLLSDVGDVFDWYSFTPDVQEERERERERAGVEFPKTSVFGKMPIQWDVHVFASNGDGQPTSNGLQPILVLAMASLLAMAHLAHAADNGLPSRHGIFLTVRFSMVHQTVHGF